MTPIRLSLAHLTVLDAHPLELVDAAVAGHFDAIGLRIDPPVHGAVSARAGPRSLTSSAIGEPGRIYAAVIRVSP